MPVPKHRKLKVAMLVVDANDVSHFIQRDEARQSPVLHNAVHTLLDGLKERGDIEIEVLYGRREAWNGENRWEGCIHYVPVTYRNFPLPGIGGPYLGRTVALSRYLRKSGPDLVHAQGSERESALVAALAGFPSILTLHGNLTEIARTMRAKPLSYFGLASRLEMYALGRVTGVHCISEHTRRSVSSRARNTWTIPNAVSCQYFDVKREPSTSPQVVCMSGISEWKNPILLAKASDALRNVFPDATVHFFGACDESHPYGRAFLDVIKERPWCVSHGNSTRETLLTALSRASCAVLPSKQESFGLALAEAMAAGVPCIGSDAGGIPDVIRNHVTGLLFSSDDETTLANCLLEIHRNPTQTAEMASAGREDALRRFTAAAVAEAHIRMYRELVTTHCAE